MRTKRIYVDVEEGLYNRLAGMGKDLFPLLTNALEDIAVQNDFDRTFGNQVLLKTQEQRRAAASVHRWETGGKV